MILCARHASAPCWTQQPVAFLSPFISASTATKFTRAVGLMLVRMTFNLLSPEVLHNHLVRGHGSCSDMCLKTIREDNAASSVKEQRRRSLLRIDAEDVLLRG
ncbi:hypothetical protein PENSPDRAFT_649488 [Peniophora sp. CONT]|nr:hypothetical protein PENSPDRAFT_649488 [Peniophora sp. CONT]